MTSSCPRRLLFTRLWHPDNTLFQSPLSAVAGMLGDASRLNAWHKGLLKLTQSASCRAHQQHIVGSCGARGPRMPGATCVRRSAAACAWCSVVSLLLRHMLGAPAAPLHGFLLTIHDLAEAALPSFFGSDFGHRHPPPYVSLHG